MMLFPAYAGVILIEEKRDVLILSFPRVCGGDPGAPGINRDRKTFSPRMRG